MLVEDSPTFIGSDLQLFLSGLCTCVFYRYLPKLRRDPPLVRCWVLAVFALNIAITVCNVLISVRWGTTQDRTTEALWGLSKLDCVQPVLEAMVGFLVQAWFVKRSASVRNSRSLSHRH